MFQIPIGRTTVFRWSPPYLPDPNAAAPSAVFKAGASTATVQLSRHAAASILSVPDRHRLRSNVNSGDLAGVVGDLGGQWWFYATGFGQFPVSIRHYDGANEDFVLAEPLPHGIPTGATGTLYHNRWSCTLNAGAIGADVIRSGFWQIDWASDYDIGGTNIPGRTHTDRGRLRVVRAPFETGLTSMRLLTMVPALESTRPANRDSWQELIEDIDIIGAVEERLPSNRYADQTLGEQWMRSHALLVAAHIAEVGFAPNVDAERMRALADEELARQARRIHWLDADDDGAIDDGEAAIAGTSLISLTVSSGADTTTNYTDNKRFQPVLNDQSDR
jgi:hypothetical protein